MQIKSIWLAVALISMFGSSALAEKALLLTPDADAAVPPQMVPLAQGLVEDWIRERGIETVVADFVSHRVPQDLRDCSQPSCAFEYLQHLQGIEFAIVVKLSGDATTHRIQQVNITAVTRDGSQFHENWPVSEALEFSIDAALVHVYTDLLRKQTTLEDNRGVAANIESDPSSLSQSKGSSHESATTDHLDSDLSRNGLSSQYSIWNYWIGGGLLVGAVTLAVFPVLMAVKDGDCYEKDENDHCRRYNFGLQSITELGGSAVLAAVGTYFLIATPITVESQISAQSSSALIQFSGTF